MFTVYRVSVSLLLCFSLGSLSYLCVAKKADEAENVVQIQEALSVRSLLHRTQRFPLNPFYLSLALSPSPSLSHLFTSMTCTLWCEHFHNTFRKRSRIIMNGCCRLLLSLALSPSLSLCVSLSGDFSVVFAVEIVWHSRPVCADDADGSKINYKFRILLGKIHENFLFFLSHFNPQIPFNCRQPPTQRAPWQQQPQRQQQQQQLPAPPPQKSSNCSRRCWRSRRSCTHWKQPV